MDFLEMKARVRNGKTELIVLTKLLVPVVASFVANLMNNQIEKVEDDPSDTSY